MSSFLNQSHKSQESLNYKYVYINKSVVYLTHFLLISKVNALQINKLAKLHNPKQGLPNFVDTLTFRLRAWFLYLSNAFMLGITVNSIVINLKPFRKQKVLLASHRYQPLFSIGRALGGKLLRWKLCMLPPWHN